MIGGSTARPRSRPGRFQAWRYAEPGPHGFSLVELMFVVSIAAVMAVVAIPQVVRDVDGYRTLGASRFVAARLQRARADAIARGANVALRFSGAGRDIRFTGYLDGNGDGVSSRDILAGIDREVAAVTDLLSFGGVTFAVDPGIPDPDGTVMTDGDPVRFGSARMVSFTPRGTATPGSLYIAGRGGHQYVVRVFGDTGRTHILKFDRRRRQWQPL